MRNSHESWTLQVSPAAAGIVIVITVIGIATAVDAIRVVRIRVIDTQYIQRICFWRQVFQAQAHHILRIEY